MLDEMKKNEVLNNIMSLLENQSEKGYKKYGHLVRPNELDFEQWVDHASEEIIDLLVYLQCMKMAYKKEK